MRYHFFGRGKLGWAWGYDLTHYVPMMPEDRQLLWYGIMVGKYQVGVTRSGYREAP